MAKYDIKKEQNAYRKVFFAGMTAKELLVITPSVGLAVFAYYYLSPRIGEDMTLNIVMAISAVLVGTVIFKKNDMDLLEYIKRKHRRRTRVFEYISSDFNEGIYIDIRKEKTERKKKHGFIRPTRRKNK